MSVKFQSNSLGDSQAELNKLVLFFSVVYLRQVSVHYYYLGACTWFTGEENFILFPLKTPLKHSELVYRYIEFEPDVSLYAGFIYVVHMSYEVAMFAKIAEGG